MVATNLIEKSRITIQKDIDSQKPSEERKKLGQYATPSALAIEMLQHTCAFFQGKKIRFLDPAFGTGVFFSACLDTFTEKIEKAVGFEIDTVFWKAASELWTDEKALQIINSDFTKVTIPKNEQEKFNLIVCNPPYVRHQAMCSSEKKRLGLLMATTLGIRPSGYSGLYCYFLLLSHHWLSKNGIACWLIPSEFMDVNYGKQVKDYLLNKVTLLHIHRFKPSEVQFNDALVSSAIVLFRNEAPPEKYSIDFSFGGTLSKPSLSKFIPVEALKATRKWSGFPVNSFEINQKKRPDVLGELFIIKRGIATGANDFFILSLEKAQELCIPEQFLKPIFPPPRCLKEQLIHPDENGNPLIDQKLMLLSCTLSEGIIKKEYPSLWRYLLDGQEQKIDERYICRHRLPWYSQEKRAVAPFLLNIIGRPIESKKKGYRFILNKSRAIATNNYLMLYPNENMQKMLNKDPNLLTEVWIMLNSIPLADLLREGRVYGGGLYKIEPKELARVSSPILSEFIQKLQRATLYNQKLLL